MNRLLVIVLLGFHFISWSHSGGTDRRGGHHDRSDNSYHFHHGERAHLHENGKCLLVSRQAHRGTIQNEPASFPWWLVTTFFRIILLMIIAVILYKAFL